MNQEQCDKYYMRVALLTSQNSYARRRKVGAILVKNSQIISEGFNGTPSGFENECENVECTCKYVRGCAYTEKPIKEQLSFKFCANALKPLGHANDKIGHPCSYAILKTKPEVLHAESNAITKCARHGNATEGSTMYVTCSPCIECAKLIIQSGIQRLVYKDKYHNEDGLNLLIKAGIEVQQLEEVSNVLEP